MMEKDFKLDYSAGNVSTEQKFVEIERFLKSNLCHIEFTKKSGESSKMTATLLPFLIPQQILFEDTDSRIVKWDTITMWSTDRNGWRSIKTDLITSVEAIAHETHSNS